MGAESSSLAIVAVVAIVVAALAGLASGGSSDAAAKVYKAGLVSDVGRFNDRSFGQSALDGLRRAQARAWSRAALSSRGRRATTFQSLVARAAALRRHDLGRLPAGRCDEHSREELQELEIRDHRLLGEAPPFTKNKNVRGLTFATNENSYMIGCLSALMANQRGRKVISAVGGIKLPTVDIFIAGYRAGARRCVPGRGS